MEGLVICQNASSAAIGSRVEPWRVCRDNADGTRPPVTAERFHTPEEADAWITKNWPGQR